MQQDKFTHHKYMEDLKTGFSQTSRNLHTPFWNHSQSIQSTSTPSGSPIVCTCNKPSYGQMIACDGIGCTIRFHLDCVGLRSVPKGKWFCPECLPHSKILKKRGRPRNMLPVGDSLENVNLTESKALNYKGSQSQNLTCKNKSQVIDLTISWISKNLRILPNSSIKKSEIFDCYSKEICCGSPVLTPSEFGKQIKVIFPNVITRRLGSRSEGTHYHFVGIQWSSAASTPGDHSTMVDEDIGLLLAKLKRKTPTLRRCPKGARNEVAQALTALLDAISMFPSDEALWNKLLLFSYWILQVPSKSDRVKNLTKWVKDHVNAWLKDSPDIFHSLVKVATEDRQKCESQTGDNTNLGKKIEAKLSDGDIRGAIRLVTSDDTIAPSNAETLASLLEKHPTHPNPSNYPDDPIPQPMDQFETKELIGAVKSFPPGSAGGLDSLRPQILKDLISSNTGEKFTDSLLRFTNIILSGQVPKEICPVMFGGSLTALKKKSGGIRPIAVGNLWRRLVSKMVIWRMTPELLTYFSPHQLGVGVKGGAEAGAHTASRYFSSEHSTPKVFLKIDFKNAFNEIRRDTLLTMVKEKFPQYYIFFSQAYRNETILYHGTSKIYSRRGVQQGDPAGPALFAMVIHPIVLAMKSELNIWFLDDGTVAGDPSTVLDDFKKIQHMANKMGLTLNHTKCELGILGCSSNEKHEILETFRRFAPGIQLMTPEKSMLLGAPLTTESTEEVLKDKITRFINMSTRLYKLSYHSAFFLLKASISIPRLNFILRVAPTWKHREKLVEYDGALKMSLETILNCKLSEDSWTQSSLPVRLGGLGINHSIDLAIPCYLASVHSVLPLVSSLLPNNINPESPEQVEGIRIWTEYTALELPSLEKRGLQSTWSTPIHILTQKILLESTSEPSTKARLLAYTQPEASSWLSALPSPQLGTLLDNESFRVSCALRLGSDICEIHRCLCGTEVSSKAHHGLSCKKSAGRRSRHESCNDIITRALRSAEVPSLREPIGCSRTDGKRPDGLTLIPWARGKCLVWDFTCRDTFAASYLPSTMRYVGFAAEKAESEKHAKYDFLKGKYIFKAIAVETSGVWGKEGLHLIREIGERISLVTGEKKSTTYLFERLGIAIQRGNVASILGSLPRSQDLEEIYFL